MTPLLPIIRSGNYSIMLLALVVVRKATEHHLEYILVTEGMSEVSSGLQS